MSIAKRKLTLVWFCGGGALFCVLVIQSLRGMYADRYEEVWSWFLPMLVPILTLIVGVLLIVSDALGKSEARTQVDRFVFRLSLWLSIAYLLLIFLNFMTIAVLAVPPVQLMKRSTLWLLPMQGLVSASLGAFFVNKTK